MLLELYYIFSRLLEYNQAIYVPSVKPESIVFILNQFCQHFDASVHHIIVIVECVECTFNYRAEIGRIKPIKKEVKVLVCD